MKITVGVILFNADSAMPKGMLEQWLKQAYKIGDQILVTEGATKARNHYFDGDTSKMTEDGRSNDKTIEILQNFPDPEDKIIIFQTNGFWDGKTRMTNAWNDDVEGDYIWLSSADEFYLEQDIEKVFKVLKDERPDQVDFFADHFWGDYNNCVDERSDGSWGNDIPWERIFKHEPGSSWSTHEPPRYRHPDGKHTVDKKLIDKYQTLGLGVKMKHYGFVSKEQIDFKGEFYQNHEYRSAWEAWQKDHSSKIVGGSTTFPYLGEHPELAKALL